MNICQFVQLSSDVYFYLAQLLPKAEESEVVLPQE